MAEISYARANRQYVEMTPNEIWDFIASQRVMFVGLAGNDGYPHVTPVWHVVDNKTIYFRGSSYKTKMRLAASAPICCTFADGTRYIDLRGVVVRGTSSLVKDESSLERVHVMIQTKYADMNRTESNPPSSWLTARAAEKSSTIKVEPERISSWDNGKLSKWQP